MKFNPKSLLFIIPAVLVASVLVVTLATNDIDISSFANDNNGNAVFSASNDGSGNAAGKTVIAGTGANNGMNGNSGYGTSGQATAGPTGPTTIGPGNTNTGGQNTGNPPEPGGGDPVQKQNITGISFEDAQFNLDGDEHSIFISGNLPEGVSVSYTGNNQSSTGAHIVTAIFSMTPEALAIYNPLPNLTATLTISPATKQNITGITFSNATITQDGDEHSILIGGTSLPEGVSVSYTGNNQSEPGSYTVTASFSMTDEAALLYNPLTNLSATLTIKPMSTYRDSVFEYSLNRAGTGYSVSGWLDETNTDVVIPSTANSLPVIDVSSAVFRGNNKLTSIVVPDSCTSLNASFKNCTSLATAVLPSNITSLSSSIFEGCSALTSVSLPTSLLSIPSSSFKNCVALSTITIPNSVHYVYDNAFSGCTLLSSIDLPKVTRVSSKAFYNCTSLTSVTISTTIETIGFDAFDGCSSGIFNDYGNGMYLGSSSNPYIYYYHTTDDDIVTANDFHTNTRVIGPYAFKNCNKLTSVSLPTSIKYIGSGAFYGCSSLSSFTYPDFTLIESEMFYECSSLSFFIIPSTVNNIGSNAFYGCSSLTSITIPSNVNSISPGAFGSCSSLTHIIIPSTVNNIGDGAFQNCTQLASVVLQGNLDSIPNQCFRNCNALSSIELPTSITYIGPNAFENCSSLPSISIPSSVTEIASMAFEGCTSLSYTEYSGGDYLGNSSNPYLFLWKAHSQDISSCTIHSNAKILSQNAFENCSSLPSLRIPSNIIEFETNAISGCSQLSYIVTNSTTKISGSFSTLACPNLTSIFFYGDHSGYWEQVYHGALDSNITLYYFSPTQPASSGNYWHGSDGEEPMIW